MKIEEEIRETLGRRMHGVGEEVGQWHEVERRVRRALVRRLASRAASAALIVAAIAVAVPTLMSDERSPGLTNPSAEPPSVFREEQDRFQFSFPADWRVASAPVDSAPAGEVTIELTPPGDPGELSVFSVELSISFGKAYDDHTGFGDVLFQTLSPIAGAPAVRWEETVDEGTEHARRRVWYGIDWTGRRAEWAPRSCPAGKECGSLPDTLGVLMTFQTQPELWDSYAAAGQQIIDSFDWLDGADYPTGPVVYTRHGRVDDGIQYDARTAVLVQFMDARVQGKGAERLMEQGGPPEGPISRYTVHERRDADANSAEFVVEVEGKGSFTETIGVGPGRSGDLVITFVKRT